MTDSTLQEYVNKLQTIREKYKGNNLLYKKIKRACERFERCKPVNKHTYQQLAKLTAKIDFKCRFEKGKCREHRTVRCCCSNCAFYFGYLGTMFMNYYSDIEDIEEQILYYVKKYTLRNGFWRRNKGCILPREMRSATCLTYNCCHHLTNEEKLLLDLISWKGYRLAYISRIIKMLTDYFLYRKV